MLHGERGNYYSLSFRRAKPARAQPVSDKLIADRYEIQHRIGRGGMGSVYLAKDLRLMREVAIKVLLDDDIDGDSDSAYFFQREARAAAALQHPGIVQVFDYSGPNERPAYIVMEVVRGENLHALIHMHTPMPEYVIIACFNELAAALAHAHGAGVMHRDLKPGNILVAPNGRVALTDFGLAKAYRDPEQLGRTVSGRKTEVFGTPGFMSPEQIMEAESGPESDIFALGCVVYAMAVGESPFAGDDPVQAMRRIAEVRYAHLGEVRPELSPELIALVERCLVADILERAEASELEEATRALLHARGLPDARSCVQRFLANDPPEAARFPRLGSADTAPAAPPEDTVIGAAAVDTGDTIIGAAAVDANDTVIGAAAHPGATDPNAATAIAAAPTLDEESTAPTPPPEPDTFDPNEPITEPDPAEPARAGDTRSKTTLLIGAAAITLGVIVGVVLVPRWAHRDTADGSATSVASADGDAALAADDTAPDASPQDEAAAPEADAPATAKPATDDDGAQPDDPEPPADAAPAKPATDSAAAPAPAAEPAKEAPKKPEAPKKVSRPRRKPAPKRPAPPAEPVQMQIAVIPWGTIYVDGKKIGNFPLVRFLEATPGKHKVEVVHPKRGRMVKTVVFGKQKLVEFESRRPLRGCLATPLPGR